MLSLVYRNLVAASDRIFLVWQIAFPVVYIFVAGYAYSAMIGDKKSTRVYYLLLLPHF